MVEQAQAGDPLGALPEVQVGHEQPGRATVLRIERLSVVGESDPRLAVGDVFKREIGRVAAVTEGDHIGSVVLDLLEQRVDGHALPGRG